MNNLIAIIPARGGSKGLPRKNIIDLNGKPLIAYTIEAAIQSAVFDKVVVTTDSEEIKNISLSFGAEVIERPSELATDTASSLDVIEHVLSTFHDKDERYTHFMLLQPTSPLRNENHIKEALEKYSLEKVNSLVSVQEDTHSPYKSFVLSEGEIKPLIGLEYMSMPRQKLPKTYSQNGAIYLCEVHRFMNTKNLFDGKLSLFIMSEKESVDIDTIEDLEALEEVKWQ